MGNFQDATWYAIQMSYDYRIIIEFFYCVGPVSAAAFYGDFNFHIFLLE